MSGPNRPSNITLRLLHCVALPSCRRLERSWTYGLTRPRYEWIWSTTLLTGRRLEGRSTYLGIDVTRPLKVHHYRVDFRRDE
jgi:hypothetical protein